MNYSKLIRKEDLGQFPVNYRNLKPLYIHRKIDRRLTDEKNTYYETNAGLMQVDRFCSSHCLPYGPYKETGGNIELP